MGYFEISTKKKKLGLFKANSSKEAVRQAAAETGEEGVFRSVPVSLFGRKKKRY